MRILVTGASGFVGGALLRRCAERPGVTAFGIARRPTGLVNYGQVDLSRPFDLDFVPDVVVHAAARAAPWGTRREYFEQNVLATRHVVEFCERKGRPRLLYISTSSVFYREEDQLGLTEESPIGPDFVNEYAASKYRGEQEAVRYGGETIILRPRAVFGPGDAVLFPRILAAARRGALPLLVGRATPARGDLIYIDTLCDYILAAAALKAPEPSYNLTNGEPVDMQAMLLDVLARLDLPAPRRRVSIATALRAAGLLEIVFRTLRLRGEPPITRFGVSVLAYSKTFDTARAQRDLGPPTVSIADGIERFVAWQRAQ